MGQDVPELVQGAPWIDAAADVGAASLALRGVSCQEPQPVDAQLPDGVLLSRLLLSGQQAGDLLEYVLDLGEEGTFAHRGRAPSIPPPSSVTTWT